MPSLDVSILIATYGDESWEALARSRALPSAQNQEPCEILIGHDPEGTIAEARNGLAERAVGEWLCFLDADDELGPGFIQAMQRVYGQRLETDGVPPLLTPAVAYVRNGRRQRPRFPDGNDLSKNNFLVVGTLVQRDLFHSVGGFEDYPHGFEDWSLWAKCWKAGSELVQVKQAVYIAYVNPRSKHRMQWRDRKWQDAMHKKVAAELFPESEKLAG
jgi:glycosyltransferase involved in cell wall biosynthesis